MQWYYAQDNEQKGPVDETTFRRLIAQHVIRPETLVWHEQLDKWQPWEEVSGTQPSGHADAPSVVCGECGRRFLPEQTIKFGDTIVCAQCKPIYFQKMREGAALPGMLLYGGFWIRGLAFFIDGFILFFFNSLVSISFSSVMPSDVPSESNMWLYFAATGIPMLFNMAVSCAYSTWFVGRFAATPGKMVCGLRIVLPDGGRVSYLRAFARYFAEMLSAIILYIGYIMAAFDEEKRSLHDRICDTRVVRK